MGDQKTDDLRFRLDRFRSNSEKGVAAKHKNAHQETLLVGRLNPFFGQVKQLLC